MRDLIYRYYHNQKERWNKRYLCVCMCNRDDNDDKLINDDNDGDYDDDGDGGHTGVHPTTPHMGRQSSLSLVNSRSPSRLSHPHANIPTACLCLCVCVCGLSLCICVYMRYIDVPIVFLIVLIFGSVDISNPTCPYQSAAPPLRYSQVHPNDAQICQFAHLTPTRENGRWGTLDSRPK